MENYNRFTNNTKRSNAKYTKPVLNLPMIKYFCATRAGIAPAAAEQPPGNLGLDFEVDGNWIQEYMDWITGRTMTARILFRGDPCDPAALSECDVYGTEYFKWSIFGHLFCLPLLASMTFF